MAPVFSIRGDAALGYDRNVGKKPGHDKNPNASVVSVPPSPRGSEIAHELSPLPGSQGERELQKKYGTASRATAFYGNQVLDHLNGRMSEFINRQTMMFIATADAHGECDCSFRAGPPGFVVVVEPTTLLYPEYRGNGVMASLGNISENPQIGLMFVDFFESRIGLHINGRAEIIEDRQVMDHPVWSLKVAERGSSPKPCPVERWVKVKVREAYIHCSKHVPLLQRLDQPIYWGTDDPARKGGDYFCVKGSVC